VSIRGSTDQFRAPGHTGIMGPPIQGCTLKHWLGGSDRLSDRLRFQAHSVWSCAQDALDRILPTVHKTMRSIIECRPLDICSLCPWTLQLRCTLLIPYMRSALNVIHTLDRSKSHHYNVEKKIYRNIASFDAILRLPLHYTVFIRKRCGNVPL